MSGAVRWAPAALVSAAAAASAVGFGLVAATPRASIPVGWRIEEISIFLVMPVSFAAVGFVLATRRRDNPIGWLFLGASLLTGSQILLGGYAVFGLLTGGLPGAELAAWAFSVMSFAIAPLAGAALVLFPEGRTVTPAGRMALGAVSLGAALLAFVVGLRPGPLATMPFVENPFARPDLAPVTGVAGFVVVPVIAVGVFVLMRHLDQVARGATGTLALQLKWLLWSGLVMVGAVAVWMSVTFAIASTAADQVPLYLTRVTVALSVSTLPIAVGIAILRHRLYDIDLLIKATLVYGALSAVLVASYVAAVIVLSAPLRAVTGGSEIAVAGSTLATLALVQPLRRRIQDAVDRRFYRSRYDAALALDAFSGRLRDEVDLDALRADVLDAVAETVRPSHATVWIRNAFRTPRA